MDIMTASQRSKLMSRITSKDTKPERQLRSLLHSVGYRFRLHGNLPVKKLTGLREEHQDIRFRGGKLPGSPDLVFTARHKVIFMNGCFWHGHDCAVGNRRPSTNTEFWKTKLDSNILRDQYNRRDIEILGWESLTIWECELKSLDKVLDRAIKFLGPRKTRSNAPKSIILSES